MSDKTGISWTDATWNPVRGCTKDGDECTNCYAQDVAHRFSGPGKPYEGLTRVIGGRGQWNGVVRTVPDKLDEPLRWSRPRMVFVNSMSDLFHEGFEDAYIDSVFDVMRRAKQHTFQVLTKRAERMQRYLADKEPLPNIWAGVSIGRVATRDAKLPFLRRTNAAVRFISAEPLLEDIAGGLDLAGIHWVISGGESGPRARQMHPDWARAIRDKCIAYGVAHHFKQWGDYTEYGCALPGHPMLEAGVNVGAKKGGNVLDGRVWQEFPR